MLLDGKALSVQEVLNNSTALSNKQCDGDYSEKDGGIFDNVDICCILQREIHMFYKRRYDFCDTSERLRIVTDLLGIDKSKTKKEKYSEIENKTDISESTCRNNLFDPNKRPSKNTLNKLIIKLDQNENNEVFWRAFGWYPVAQNNIREKLVENKLRELANEDQIDLQNLGSNLLSKYKDFLAYCVFLDPETFENAIVGEKIFSVQTVYHLLIYFVSDEFNGREISNECLEEKYHLFGLHPLSEGSVDDIIKICITCMSPYVRLTNEVRRAEDSLKAAEKKKVTDTDKYLKTFREAYRVGCHNFWLILDAILSDCDKKNYCRYHGQIMTLVRDPSIAYEKKYISQEISADMKQREKTEKEAII